MAGCRALNESEIKLVLSKLTTTRDKSLFVLGIRSGFRISELLSLQVKDVYSGHRVLDLVRVARRNTKGKAVSRTIPLHREARDALYAHCLGKDMNAPLFQSRNGENKPITRVMAHKILKAAYAAAGLSGPGLATHTMRKSFAEKVYASLQYDLVATKEALGHSSIFTTALYLAPNKAKVNAAILA